MTANEFKAWFEGFTEAIGEAPTPEQWKRIREQVKAIDPDRKPTVYPDQWVRYPVRGWDLGKVTTRGSAAGVPAAGPIWLSDDYPAAGTSAALAEELLERDQAKLEQAIERAFAPTADEPPRSPDVTLGNVRTVSPRERHPQIDAHAWKDPV